jgi:glycosyltransferase involved in cell wall biosynthesis
VFCLPSYYGEGVPKVLLEAAAAGKALITTDMPGCREVVIAGVNGLQVEPRNPIALATAIKTLLSDRELCSRMGAESRALAEREFDVERVKEQTIALYEELLNT